MKKVINKLDLELYQEKLDNGLEVYIVPKNNVNNIYATFTTKYGSSNLSFELDGEKIDSKPGIAHFLEHKIFEQKDGSDVFQIFDKNGAMANALTSSFKTTYLFSCPTNFEENLNLLLDFVQEPYFTDQNVEKEKGIIIQELKRNKDNPYRVGYEEIMKNCFINHPLKTPVIGYIDSINDITKEDLMECYNAFYDPSNMFIVITGNVDPKKTIKIIKENQKNKKFKKYNVKKIDIDEPDNILNKKVITHMNVVIPKVNFTYKISLKNIDINPNKLNKYLSIYLDSLFGPVSDFAEEIEKEKISESNVYFMTMKTDKHLIISFSAETNKTNKLIDKIKKYIGKSISEEEFNRKKKVFLSSLIYMSDNIFSINDKITNDIVLYDEVTTDIYKDVMDLDYLEMNSIINQLDFKYNQIVIIKPNKAD